MLSKAALISFVLSWIIGIANHLFIEDVFWSFVSYAVSGTLFVMSLVFMFLALMEETNWEFKITIEDHDRIREASKDR